MKGPVTIFQELSCASRSFAISFHFRRIIMNQIKNIKGQRGFTLVEVIVVAIIVAALAAVAVPMYTSYVTSSRENAAANAAGSVASYMGACINQGGSVTSAPALPHAGTANTTLTCSATGAATIQLPIGIHITISDLAATGVVTAYHVNYAAGVKTYNY
jgi:prepilin-type N-terminal cleavage/methylation domain-containing protein